MAAYGNNPGPESDYYSDEATSPSRAEEAEKEGGEEGEPTDIISKSLLAGKTFKPGDEVIFKIVRFVGDDQVQIKYSYGDEEGSEEEEAGESPEEEAKEKAGKGMPTGEMDSEMSSMMY